MHSVRHWGDKILVNEIRDDLIHLNITSSIAWNRA